MVYTALSHTPCQPIPTTVWCKGITPSISQKRKPKPQKGKCHPRSTWQSRLSNPAPLAAPASPLPHAVKKDRGIGDRRGGTDLQELGSQGRLPGRREVWPFGIWIDRKKEVTDAEA